VFAVEAEPKDGLPGQPDPAGHGCPLVVLRTHAAGWPAMGARIEEDRT